MWQHCYTCAKESIIFVANTRAPFRSIIQHYIVSMIFRLCCCYCCHSETSLSFNLSLFFSFSISLFLSIFLIFLLCLCLYLSLCAAQFLKILSIYISNRLFSSVSVRNFVSRAMCFSCTYTRATALSLYFHSLVLVSYVSVSEGCLICTDILHRR